MMTRMFRALALCAGMGAGMAQAQMHMEMEPKTNVMRPGGMARGGHMMQAHGPLGVAGRHVLPKGKVMLGFSLGHMEMNGLRSGTTDLSADTLVTTVPNRFFGLPGQPPTLRVAPLWMKGEMAMFGAMYGLTDRVTLMGMVPYLKKEMASVTYAGAAGTTVLGPSRMRAEGFGDVTLGALVGLRDRGREKLTLGLGLSLPTGSITESGPMLSPMGMRMVGRMGYGMQLGSGTYDLLPQISWQTGKGRWNWGAQARGVIRLGSNDEGYSLGDEAALTIWGSYKPQRWVGFSAAIEGRSLGRIDGIDSAIVMPTPGADPLNHGGDSIAVQLGVDMRPQGGALKGHSVAAELGLPVWERTNGPRLEQDWSLRLAWRRAF